MKIAYLTHYDARNVRAWSGTGYNMAECLKSAGIEIDYVGPLTTPKDPLNISRYFIKKTILGKNDHPQRDPGFLRSFGRQASDQTSDLDVDVILAPGGLPLSYLDTHKPVVMWTDCTFANLLDYYPAFANLSSRNIRNGHDAERRALNNCDLVLFSSSWAADSAVHDYGISPDKIRVVPFGGNMPGERDTASLEATIAERKASLSQSIKLFSAGVDWRRKGFDLASEVVGRLNAGGLKAELHLAGCEAPKADPVPDNVYPLGFVSKSEPQGLVRLEDLFRTSHWFVFATLADCTPMVLSEAASYGLPTLARDTGGVGSMITDGANGWSMPFDAPAKAWADRIAEISLDVPKYEQLCRAAYAEYAKRLSWNVAGQTVLSALEDLVLRQDDRAQRPGLRSRVA